ncbi:organic cation/carnitine transporter 2-like [Corythoichthys intestinalis]|uniref:organic cation/carnitine transporter 2-like n=1 Tax=Corythoichthys intestinalis TaxID=161448 RepID=UPI0025A51D07|nr:organic cation/carnitine transporter 2-like [Corythoichthys intestinalis]
MSGEKCKDFDGDMTFLGEYGRFQVLMMILLSLTAIPCGYMGVLSVFIADTPAHHCKTWDNSTNFFNRTGPDGCFQYKVDTNRSEAFEPTNGSDRCVDGWLFSTESSTIVSEWDLVCENAWKVPFSTSMFFVGVLFGSLVSGQLSDRFGRKRVLFATLTFQSVTTLIQATSVNWVMFCAVNCLRGVGHVSCYVASFVLGSEMLCKSARLTYSLIGQSLAFSLGYALLPLLAYFIRDWRLLLVACAIPGLLFIPTWWVIPESPRWLLQKNRMEEAELVIRRAAKLNRVHAPDVIFKPSEGSGLVQKPGENKQTYTFMDLLRTANLRNITALGFIIWLVTAMAFYGISLNTSNLKGNIYLNSLVSAATDAVANVLTWLLINRVPRPILLSSTLMFSGITHLAVKMVPEDMNVSFQVLVLIGKLGVAVAYCMAFVFFAELYPTVVRNTGLGIVATAGRIGTIICPYVIYMGVYSKVLPYIIFGSLSIMTAVLSLVLPDTRNCKFPDLISEAKPIGCYYSPRNISCFKHSQQQPTKSDATTPSADKYIYDEVES